MRSVKRYDHETLRVSNRAIVFSALSEEGECSRFDLAKKTGISPATVGGIIDDLIREGLLREIRVGQSTGGRRPVLVDILPEGKFAIAGSLTVRGGNFSLVNLEGRIVDSRKVEASVSGEAAIGALVHDLLSSLLKDSALAPASLAGSIVAVPGMVRASDGLILHSPPLRLNSFDLSGLISEISGKPTRVIKDTDALLLAECARGMAREAENAVYIWLKEGMGMSYLHEGEVLVLPRGGFELGHTAWIRGGRLCHCGTPGCIGTELSETHAMALYKARTGREAAGGYAELCALSRAGEAEAEEVLGTQVEILGAVLANVVNLLNPGMIVLGGPLCDASPALKEALRRVTRERALPPFKGAIQVEFSALGEDEILSALGQDFFAASLFPMP